MKTKKKMTKKAQSENFLKAASEADISADTDIDEVMHRLAAQKKPTDRTLKGQKLTPLKK